MQVVIEVTFKNVLDAPVFCICSGCHREIPTGEPHLALIANEGRLYLSHDNYRCPYLTLHQIEGDAITLDIPKQQELLAIRAKFNANVQRLRELYNTELLDDVDCSLSNIAARESEIAGLEEWFTINTSDYESVLETIRAIVDGDAIEGGHYASGAPYQP